MRINLKKMIKTNISQKGTRITIGRGEKCVDNECIPIRRKIIRNGINFSITKKNNDKRNSEDIIKNKCKKKVRKCIRSKMSNNFNYSFCEIFDKVFNGLVFFLLFGVILGGISVFWIDINSIKLEFDDKINNTMFYSVDWEINVIFQNMKYVLLFYAIAILTNLKYIYHFFIFYKGYIYGFVVAILATIIAKENFQIVLIYIPINLIYIFLDIMQARTCILFINSKEKKVIRFMIKTLAFILIISLLTIFEIKMLRQYF